MRITCPECSTGFKIPDNALGTKGRKLRCSKCGHKWHQEPVPEEAPAASADAAPVEAGDEEPDAAPAADAGAGADPGTPDGGGDDGGGDGGDGEAGDAADTETGEDFEEIPFATREALRPPPKPERGPPYTLIASLLGTILVLVGMVVARGTIVGLWPPSARLYDTIGLHVPVPGEKIVIQNVGAWRDRQGEVSVLVVRGELRNISETVQTVPTMRGAILDETGGETQTWLFLPETSMLLPGEKAGFEYEFPQPAPGGDRVRLSFSSQPIERGGIGY